MPRDVAGGSCRQIDIKWRLAAHVGRWAEISGGMGVAVHLPIDRLKGARTDRLLASRATTHRPAASPYGVAKKAKS